MARSLLIKKVYFWDCGIRNAVIGNFKPLISETDKGALWDNFAIAERIKFLSNSGKDTKYYFWRTTQMQEIDLIEETPEDLNAFEFKWNKNAKVSIPLTFSSNYPDAKITVINRGNIESVVTDV